MCLTYSIHVEQKKKVNRKIKSNKFDSQTKMMSTPKQQQTNGFHFKLCNGQI
jgi:hypothetical protein